MCLCWKTAQNDKLEPVFFEGQMPLDFLQDLICSCIFGRNTKLYCTKTTYGGSGSWPRGNYCTARKGGSCPSGFRTGIIYWDDEDHNNANSKKGILPDGTYNRYTRIYYCCRSDGPSYRSIVLPTSKPFYLYHYTSTLCQRVRGISAREEFVKTDDKDTHNYSADGGSHPKKIETTRIQYCYYSSLQLLSS
ncbi:uncharacterized protein LOC134723085 [Mytilus trossulus]|uniref:uncharacterized protein LOC134723085 n=1 Tax=Mytilus trossulus TaxID=6551 RepID=UPI0030046738